MKSLLFMTLLVISSHLFASTSSKPRNLNCPTVVEASKPIHDWTIQALASANGIGCPPSSLDPSFKKLRTLSQTENNCGVEAAGSLYAFYMLFSKNPAYQMCGIEQKMLPLLADRVINTVCTDKPLNETRDCFSELFILGGKLTMLGENESAFKLTKKLAINNDPSGYSQLILSGMYLHGRGTTKNLKLSISWAKEALERLDTHKMRIHAMMNAAVAYEEIGDLHNARKYLQLCALQENTDSACIQGFDRLNKKLE